MHSYVRPNTHIALRPISGIVKIVEIKPNTNINLGKALTFPANLILGRPYYFTYEVLDKDDGRSKPKLRIVPASELHAETLGSDNATAAETRDENAAERGGAEFDIVSDNGEVIMRSNRLTIDDPSRQTLSMSEIEELKRAGTGSGKEIVAKIMASHMAIEEKTSFSLAKYTLRKSKKYLKRFTVLPLDLSVLTEYVLDKEPYKIMELREESLGLICSWANMQCGAASRFLTAEDGVSQIGGGRWIVVDDTGGLVTAALAEKMGILYPTEEADESEPGEKGEETTQNYHAPKEPSQLQTTIATTQDGAETSAPHADPSDVPPRPRRPPKSHIPQMSAQTNILTLIHANNQPNISYLKYFGYDIGAPSQTHPLYTHLKSLTWLSLLHPEEDPSYPEPEVLSDEVLANMKTSKRSTYYKKRRRWERTRRVVDETRRGGFDGLVVASHMVHKSVLKELVPLVRGGGRVVVYSPSVEPLVELCDLYSKERKAAFVEREFGAGAKVKEGEAEEEEQGIEEEEQDFQSEMNPSSMDAEDEENDFTLNPTLLLAPTLQTVRAREWQVLPERTHPMMTSRGGAEGYVFTATRVVPVEGKVEARGHGRGKKRKTGLESAVCV